MKGACIRLAGECSQCQRHLNSVTGGKGGNVLSVRLLQQRGLQDKGQYRDSVVQVSFKCRSSVVQVSFKCRSSVAVKKRERNKIRWYIVARTLYKKI